MFIAYVRVAFEKPLYKLGVPIEQQLGDVDRVLLFAYMGLGDAVMLQPTLTAILHRYPHAIIDVVASKNSQSLEVLDLVLRDSGRRFNQVHRVDFKGAGVSAINKINNELSSLGYDLCIATYTTPIPYFIRAIQSCRIRLGHRISAQNWYKPRANFLLNLSRPVEQSVDEREPYRHFRLAQALGIQLQNNQPEPHIQVSLDARNSAEGFIAAKALAGKRLVGVHVGVSSAMSWKKWPDEKWGEVLKSLNNENSVFLFFGSESELTQVEIASAYVHARAITVFDQPIEFVAALIAKCEALLSNDSGLGHLAVALKTPTLRIFGPSDHYGCEPFSGSHVTVYRDLTCSPCMNLGIIKPGYNLTNCGHRNCLNLITPNEVIHEAHQLLSSVSAPCNSH